MEFPGRQVHAQPDPEPHGDDDRDQDQAREHHVREEPPGGDPVGHQALQHPLHAVGRKDRQSPHRPDDREDGQEQRERRGERRAA